jgi:hypothetical protein
MKKVERGQHVKLKWKGAWVKAVVQEVVAEKFLVVRTEKTREEIRCGINQVENL